VIGLSLSAECLSAWAGNSVSQLSSPLFIAEMQRRLVAGANAAKIAAALLRDLDWLQETIDAVKSRLPDA
jgi:hypothetical protein